MAAARARSPRATETGNITGAAPISDTPQTGIPAARVVIRIDFPNGSKMGHGKARILELIGEHGSISAAGRAMGMSYRRAWTLIEELNKMFQHRLVDAQTGGAGGGGAVLTDAGREVLRLYRALEAHAGADTAALRDICGKTNNTHQRRG